MMMGNCRRISNSADVILVGVSRTSKTPTSIYLANRGMTYIAGGANRRLLVFSARWRR